MSDHLPECHYESATYVGEELDGVCVCRPVRAAETRVREVYESSDDYMLGIAVGMHNGWLEGHAAALDAAREAVAALLGKANLQRWLESLPEAARVTFEGAYNGKAQFVAKWKENR